MRPLAGGKESREEVGDEIMGQHCFYCEGSEGPLRVRCFSYCGKICITFTTLTILNGSVA